MSYIFFRLIMKLLIEMYTQFYLSSSPTPLLFFFSVKSTFTSNFIKILHRNFIEEFSQCLYLTCCYRCFLKTFFQILWVCQSTELTHILKHSTKEVTLIFPHTYLGLSKFWKFCTLKKLGFMRKCSLCLEQTVSKTHVTQGKIKTSE